MCAAALVHARLAGVVYGAADRLAGAVTSCTETLDQPFFNHRYMAFFLMLYREGMPGVVLFSGICAVVYFVVVSVLIKSLLQILQHLSESLWYCR